MSPSSSSSQTDNMKLAVVSIHALPTTPVDDETVDETTTNITTTTTTTASAAASAAAAAAASSTTTSTALDIGGSVLQQVQLPQRLGDFYQGLHQTYIVDFCSQLDISMEGAVTEHLRMSGVYWSLTALSLLCDDATQVDTLMGFSTTATTTTTSTTTTGGDDGSCPTTSTSTARPAILDWLYSCFDEKTGGFGGNTGQDGHLLYTLSAVQILALMNQLNHDDADDGTNNRFATHYKDRVVDFVVSLQDAATGSFVGDAWGEVDTRFTYCALSTLSILGALHRVNVPAAASYVLACRNRVDGGFGSVIGAESHAGQVFCCIGALSIAQSLHLLLEENNNPNDNNNGHDNNNSNESGVELLGWWLSERQVDSGGLNGRPEKQADVCYSWWILSALSILGHVSYINGNQLAAFILACQDEDDGGIADRPNDMADVFHTFFGIAGLSLLGHLHAQSQQDNAADSSSSPSSSFETSQQQQHRINRKIDPVYALPTDVVQRLGLSAQVLARRGETVDERLGHYNVHYLD